MDMASLLADMVNLGASDLFLTVGAAPHLKIDGRIRPHGNEVMDSMLLNQLVYSVMNDEQKTTFASTRELNMALRVSGTGRFRINVFVQQGEPALVARHVVSNIPTIDSLGLPEILKRFAMEERGLILVVGGTGTGKSTTLAAMIDYRNTHRPGHILTIEDPIEFVHSHKLSLVNQREVGIDTENYAAALKNAMREAPDVILIGEVRDQETMRSAIAYSETGHLCLTTLHASNANQAIDRILNFYNESAHKQLQIDLSQHLRGIVSQRLAHTVDGKRVAVVEVMVMTPYIQDLILQGKHDEIREAMHQARAQGCLTYDDELFKLVQTGRITMEESLRHADSRNNLSLRFRLEGTTDPQILSAHKKDVSYSRVAPFSEYKTYAIQSVKLADDYEALKPLIESSLREILATKGFEEDNPFEADLDIQYLFTTRRRDGNKLPSVENPISSRIDVHTENEALTTLIINIVDTHSQKAVWRVTATRRLEDIPQSAAEIFRDINSLLAEFPPPLSLT